MANNYIQCPKCHAWVDGSQKFCPNCGTDLSAAGGGQHQSGYGNPNPYTYPSGNTSGGFTQQFLQNDAFAASPQGSARGVAAILALILGTLGVHYFYMGKNTAGIVFLLISLLSCGVLGAIVAVITFAQGIYMFTLDNVTFYNKYVNTQETIPFF